MKKIIFMLAMVIANYVIYAQVKTPAPSPKSVLTQVVGLTDVTIDYSRPSAKGRSVFGNLVPFGKLWRTGANQNSMVTFSEDVVIKGATLKKGKYAIFTKPKADVWEIFFYSNTENWGTPENWDEKNVALSTTASPITLGNNVETFTISINNLTNDSATLDLSWEKTMVSIKFEVPTQKAAMASITKTLAGPGEDVPFWHLRLKSLIQAKLGDKPGAIATAKVSLANAEKAKNEDYVKMNNDSIKEWSKK